MNKSGALSKQQLRRRIEAAQGKIDSDLILKNARYLDVFACEWRGGDLAVCDGVVVGVESGLKAAEEIDLKGAHVVPGFIDAHLHVESTLLVPEYFEREALACGTTSAVCDPHELANVAGAKGIEYFLSAAERMTFSLWVMMSSCVPSTHFETNGAGVIENRQLLELFSHPKALGLAEMMNVPGVLSAKDEDILAKLESFSLAPIDGHCPLLRGNALSAYAAAGISSCHESSELAEAKEKLTKGIAVWIREGSVAKDLHALAPLLTLATSTSIGFCTDDRNPLDISEEGHIDFLIRSAVKLGVAPEVAYRAASWTVARHYGLKGFGAIAPGYQADLVVLDDVDTCQINTVYKFGRSIGEIETKLDTRGAPLDTVKASVPETKDLEGPKGRVHVIGVKQGKIITDHLVAEHDAKGVARITVLERYGNKRKPSNGYVMGFGEHLDGAIASSTGHDSHNLIVVGSDTQSMRTALAELIKCGGGFTLTKKDKVLATLALPIGGLMTTEPAKAIAHALRTLHQASRDIGCGLPEPFLQLAFLSLPVIPKLKITDRGLVDVEKFNFISVQA